MLKPGLRDIFIGNIVSISLVYFFERDLHTFFTILFFSTMLQILLYAIEDIRRAVIQKKRLAPKILINFALVPFYSVFCVGFIFILNQDQVRNGPGMLDDVWKLFNDNLVLIIIATIPILIGVIVDAYQKRARMYFALIHIKIVFAAFMLAAASSNWAFFFLLIVKFFESVFESAVELGEEQNTLPNGKVSDDPLIS
jgi:hypothetical protein